MFKLSVSSALGGIGLAAAAAFVALPTAAVASEPSPPCDRPHIQAHLERVEQALIAADTSHLTAAQRGRRAHHIATLAAYRERCEFPRQTVARDRLVTIFVDDADVHCAVGHLMAMDGQEALVARIRRDTNTATIQELAADAELKAWLQEAGLSLTEAARIQPTYCDEELGGDCFCPNYGPPAVLGVAEAQITRLDGAPNLVEARVTRVHGSGAVVDEVRTVGRAPGDVVGRNIMITLLDGSQTEYPTQRGPQVVDDEHVSCTSGLYADGKYCALVPTDIYISALMSEDCMSALGEYDPDMTRSRCGLRDAACMDDGTVPPEPEPVSPDSDGLTPDAATPSVSDGGCRGGDQHVGWFALAAAGLLVGLRRRSGLAAGPR